MCCSGIIMGIVTFSRKILSCFLLCLIRPDGLSLTALALGKSSFWIRYPPSGKVVSALTSFRAVSVQACAIFCVRHNSDVCFKFSYDVKGSVCYISPTLSTTKPKASEIHFAIYPESELMTTSQTKANTPDKTLSVNSQALTLSESVVPTLSAKSQTMTTTPSPVPSLSATSQTITTKFSPTSENTSSPLPAPECTSPPVPAPESTSPPVPAPESSSPPVPTPENTSPPMPTPESTSPPVPACHDDSCHLPDSQSVIYMNMGNTTGLMDWQKAQDHCSAKDPGARLVRTETRQKLDELMAALKSYGQVDVVFYWVDARFIENSGKFAWTDGTVVNEDVYEDEDSEICDTQNYDSVRQYGCCLFLNGDEKALKENPCHFYLNYLCEKDI